LTALFVHPAPFTLNTIKNGHKSPVMLFLSLWYYQHMVKGGHGVTGFLWLFSYL
jgi:hypothetical protein